MLLLYPQGWAVHWSLINLPGAAALKKADSPQAMPVHSSSVRGEAQEPLPTVCWNVEVPDPVEEYSGWVQSAGSLLPCSDALWCQASPTSGPSAFAVTVVKQVPPVVELSTDTCSLCFDQLCIPVFHLPPLVNIMPAFKKHQC